MQIDILKSLRQNHRTNYTTIPAIQRMDKVFFNQIFLANSMALTLKGALTTKTLWSISNLKDKLENTEIEISNQQKILLHDYIDDVQYFRNMDNFYKDERTFNPLIQDIEDIRILKSITTENTSIWFGPSQIITPFHIDLQNVLIGQLIGQRRLLLIPCWDYPLINGDIKEPSNKRTLSLEEAQVFEVVLDEGDCIYIPPAWSQYSESLDFNLTLSFTGF